jgi:hypothetical protein
VPAALPVQAVVSDQALRRSQAGCQSQAVRQCWAAWHCWAASQGRAGRAGSRHGQQEGRNQGRRSLRRLGIQPRRPVPARPVQRSPPTAGRDTRRGTAARGSRPAPTAGRETWPLPGRILCLRQGLRPAGRRSQARWRSRPACPSPVTRRRRQCCLGRFRWYLGNRRWYLGNRRGSLGNRRQSLGNHPGDSRLLARARPGRLGPATLVPARRAPPSGWGSGRTSCPRPGTRWYRRPSPGIRPGRS